MMTLVEAVLPMGSSMEPKIKDTYTWAEVQDLIRKNVKLRVDETPARCSDPDYHTLDVTVEAVFMPGTEHEMILDTHYSSHGPFG